MSSHFECETNWASEKAVVDDLVDAIDAGDGDQKAKCAKALLDGYAEHDWRARRIVESGGLVLHSRLTRESVDPEDLETLVSAKRLQAIEGGARLTDEEFSGWRALITERGLDSELLFYGHATAWVILQLRHSDGRVAHLAAMNWRSGSGEFVAAYRTYSEALNALKAIGTVGTDSQLAWEDQSDRQK